MLFCFWRLICYKWRVSNEQKLPNQELPVPISSLRSILAIPGQGLSVSEVRPTLRHRYCGLLFDSWPFLGYSGCDLAAVRRFVDGDREGTEFRGSVPVSV